jgi:predicted acyltransferase
MQNERLTSLDAFRGATIAAMMLVNNAGDWSHVYPQLEHAAWNGWTFTDWIFPFFLFIVGVAMTMSFARRIERDDNARKLMLNVARRSLIIFVLGLILNGAPFFDLSTIRIPGVLQRIAVCYFIVSLIVLFAKTRRTQIFWLVGALAVYWLMMKLIPVPGIGAGVLEPGKNFSAYIDSFFLSGHMYIYTQTWDPEGIVSTLPAIATTLFGVQTGYFLRSPLSREEKTVWMFVAGFVLLLIGAILDMWLPINKNIWTSSYSIFTAGWALICLAIFYWLIDVNGFKRWCFPFVMLGMNAITVYFVGSLIGKISISIMVNQPGGKSIMLKTYLYQHFFAPLAANPFHTSVLYAMMYVLGSFLLAWIMWKKQWFVKV